MAKIRGDAGIVDVSLAKLSGPRQIEHFGEGERQAAETRIGQVDAVADLREVKMGV